MSPKLFFSVVALASNYRLALYDQEQSVVNSRLQVAGLQYDSGIRDFGMRAALDIFANSNHTARVGLQLMHHRFQPGAAQYQGTEAPESEPRSHNALEGAAYVEDELAFFRKWRGNIGLRASTFSTAGQTYTSLEPRVSLSYAVTEHGAVSASFSAMQQYIHLLTSSGIGMPTDLWLPTTERVRPERALQTTIGYIYQRADLEARMEASYKQMSGLLEYREGASFAGSERDWQRKITQGNGRYVGLELYLRKQFGATTASAAYTLSRTRRRFSEIDKGAPFPYRYDRPHDVALTLSHDFSDRRSFTAFWTYGSGDAVTVPRAWYFDPTAGLGGRVYTIFGSRGNSRTPAYHRLDLVYRIKYNWSWGDGVLGLGMYNAYGRENPFYMYVDTYPANRYGPVPEVPALKLKKVSFFRFIPSISLEVTL